MTREPITVYALHALGGSGASFDAVASRLGDDVRLVTIDLPGFGDAASLPGRTVTEMADHVLARIHRDGSSRWLILGHSMGGKVASVVARRAVAGADPVFGFAGVVLLAGSPPTPEPMPDDKRAEMLGWLDGPGLGAHAQEFVDANTGRPLAAPAQEHALADVSRTDPDAWRSWMTEGSREDVSALVGVVDAPAVILAGEDDADLGADAQPRLHGAVYPRARFVRLPGTGHFVPQERPDDVVAAITALCAAIADNAPVVPPEWARLIASTAVEPRVRAALAARAVADDPAYAPRAVTAAQLATLRALADIVVPQPAGPGEGRIDLAARYDRQLAAGEGDGWRPAALPPDAVASGLALDALAAAVAQGQTTSLVEKIIAGECEPADSALPPAQLQAWFEDVRVDLIRHWLAHPASLARTGNDAFATRGIPDPRGFAVLGAGLRAPWEPDELGAAVAVADDRRPTADGEDAA